MNLGDLAGLIAAGAFLILVIAIAVPLVKLGKMFDRTSTVIEDVGNKTMPLMDEVTTTVSLTNTQLERVDAITRSVQSATESISGLTQTFSDTLGSPLLKAAAYTYGMKNGKRNSSFGRRGRKGSRPRSRYSSDD